MTEAKHTPGPWDQVPEGDNWIWLFHEPSQTRVARVVLYSGKEDENRDNARLIAAAPDMLEALKPFTRLLDVVEHMGGPTITETVCEFESHVAGIGRLTMSDLRAARSAIAKATGG